MRALTGLATAFVLLAAPSASLAQTELPVGRAHGVRIVREHGGIVVVFSKRAAGMYKRIAGKRVNVDCTDEPPQDQGPPHAHAFLTPHNPGEIVEVTSGGNVMRAPEHGRRLVTGDGTRGLDYCRVWRTAYTVRRHGYPHRVPRRLIVSIPLTQAGAVFLDEESKARRLFSMLLVAGAVSDDLKISGWPSYAQIVDRFKPFASVLVELATPDDTPPPRRIGYYSDRADHVAVVTLSRSGKRLLIESDGDTLTTNVTQYLFDNL